MSCSNSPVDALGLRQLDNTNNTRAADVEQIIIRWGNNAINEVNKSDLRQATTIMSSTG